MNITIDSKIQIDESDILDIINNHPLNTNLFLSILELFVRSKDERSSTESIDYNMDTKIGTLYLCESKNYNNCKYILYHEFSHIADMTNPDFSYCENKKNGLDEEEKQLVMSLWNLYIDSRLNMHGHFQVDEKGYGQTFKYGKLPGNIEGYLMYHINFLCTRNVNNAEYYVNLFWENPRQRYSYDDLIKIVKENTSNLRTSSTPPPAG